MPLTVQYAKNAVDCPSVRVPSSYNDPNAADPLPVRAAKLTAGASGAGSQTTPFNQNAVRIDNLGLYGGGGYCIGQGCGISEGTGLQAVIAAGLILPSGNLIAAQNLALTNGHDNYLWALQTGVLASPVIDSLTPPSADATYLGVETCAGSVVTVLDRSGVLENRFGLLWRRTADAGAPGDTPPAGIALFTRTAGGLYLWDGAAHRLVSDQLPLSGGTLTGLLTLAAAGLAFDSLFKLTGIDGASLDSLLVQDVSANIATGIEAMPKGTPALNAFGATAIGSLLGLFATDGVADAVNFLRAVLYCASDRWGLAGEQGGTGTLQPFYIRQGTVDGVKVGTAGELEALVSLKVGAGTAVKQIKTGTVTLDPASLAGITTRDDSVTITGVAVGDRVELDIPSALEAGLVYGGCYVSAADTVKIRLGNITAAPIDGASLSWAYTWWKLT